MDVKTLEELPKTVVCDIDGCIFKHMGNLPRLTI